MGPALKVTGWWTPSQELRRAAAEVFGQVKLTHKACPSHLGLHCEPDTTLEEIDFVMWGEAWTSKPCLIDYKEGK